MGTHQALLNGLRHRAVVLGLVASVLLSATAHAEAGAPSVDVLQVGWGGTVVPGTWSPVRVRVTGGTADTSAQVQVMLYARYMGGQAPQTRALDFPVASYDQDLVLPAGSTKETTIWVPTDGYPTGTVRLSADGAALAELPIEFHAASTPAWPLVGILAQAPTIARRVEQIELPYQGLTLPLGVAELAAGDLPSLSERLTALSALVVQGNAADTLTGEQRRAIVEWVRAGGHLVLIGGPDAARAATVLPGGTLPLTFGSADAAADLAPLATWAGANAGSPGTGPVGRFQAGVGIPLAGTGERPLAWRAGVGGGTVTLLAADPALEPLVSWSGTPVLLRKALEPALPTPGTEDKALFPLAQERNVALRLQGALDALPAEAFPDWQTVGIVLGGFALVVGPLLYVLLWRADRRSWIWLAVPACAALLSGGLYVVGIQRGGRDVVANVVTYVRLEPETGQARQAVAAGFFAPTHEQLVVDVPGEVSVRATGRWDPAGPAQAGLASRGSEPPFHVVSGRDTRVEFQAGQWGQRVVLLDRRLGGDLPTVVASLSVQGGLIRGTIRNTSPVWIEDAAVAVGQSLIRLGTLAPGQTAPVVLDPATPWNPAKGGYPLSLRLFGQSVGTGPVAAAPGFPTPAITAPGAAERFEQPHEIEPVRRARLMDLAIANQPRPGPSPTGSSLPLTFFAFTRQAVGSALPSVGDRPVQQLTLLQQRLQLAFGPGPFSLPPGLVPVEPLAQNTPNAGGAGSNGVVFWLEVRSGSVTYTFRPPLPPRARVDALQLLTQQVGSVVPLTQSGAAPPPPTMGVAPAEAGVFRIYNWQSAAWEALPAGQEQPRVAPGGAYVGPDGSVKVQINSGADHLVRAVFPELTVDGTVPP